MSIIDKYLNEAVLKATDTSGGVHPHEGYPEIDIPAKLLGNISRTIGPNKILKAWKYENGQWTFQMNISNGFEVRNKDFQDLFKIGLIGFRYEAPKSILLFFKGNY